ncbi:bifunctional diaminohydroxyphosphoribosylaminopyrimidine deaminase/5-amino-6-(5-phosphoribosylamino)uracil reductase RibD [soil metagenome]
MTIDTEQLMRRALSLAAHGPAGINPQVGCVLVNADGEIVAEGWHRGAGTPHAEVDALSQLTDARGLTAIVSLEPCNHTGRTGPCSVALIEAGVSAVVYSVSDPNPNAHGGAERLRDAGVDVTGGVLEAEVSEFLRPWITTVVEGRPFVTLKWASSLDGRAAAADGTSQWITGTAARQRVHEQRAASDAIVVGTGTALADNPSLTARGDAGELMPRQPIPVVIGTRPIAADSTLARNGRTIVEQTHDLGAVLIDLFDRGIRSVFVEGGPTLASAFIAAGLVDEYLVYLAPTIIGGPTTAITDVGVATIGDQRQLTITSIEQLGDDLLLVARPKGT